MRDATAGPTGDLRRELAPRDPMRSARPHLVGRSHPRADHEAGSNGTLARRLGGVLRALRVERGWNQRTLAGRLALSEAQLSRYETGTREIPFQTLIRIAGVFRVSLDIFTAEEELQFPLHVDDLLFECFRWVGSRSDTEKQTALRVLVPEILGQPQLVERFLEVAKSPATVREAALGVLQLVLASLRFKSLRRAPRLPALPNDLPLARADLEKPRSTACQDAIASKDTPEEADGQG
jgi:transcriptional regulator with XRE-family HTH domain